MNKIATTGKRFLKDDRWHDDNGPLPDTPLDWDPPMTDEEVHIAALSDPDAQPRTKEQLDRMRPMPLSMRIRWDLGLSRAEFSLRFGIPLNTLIDWERGKLEPDAGAVAYLKVIQAEPDVVSRVIANSYKTQAAE